MSGRRLSVIVLCTDWSLWCGYACFLWCLLLILETRLHFVACSGVCTWSRRPNIAVLQYWYQALPWLRRSVASLSRRRPGFNSRPVPFGVYGGQNSTGRGFSPSTSVFPVSIIPPLLHTHSFIYHPHCIMFFSQFFSFPLSVSFHHCSIFIHSSTTHTV